MASVLAPEKVAVDVLISADSHVMEPADLWSKSVPESLRDHAPSYVDEAKSTLQFHSGGRDPSMRASEMAADGVSAEILYPTRALDQFGLTDSNLQEACFKVYNDWLKDYCSPAPERLFGVACVSTYNIDNAIKEAERCKKAGFRGLMIWLAPPDEISFATDHHDRFWAAVQDLDMPVSLHCLTGAPFPPGVLKIMKTHTPAGLLNMFIPEKLGYIMKSLSNLLGAGVFDRYPKLKMVMVENEVSWLPFYITQLEKYSAPKYRERLGLSTGVQSPPRDYFGRNIFATFFNDPPAAAMMETWGATSWMWSSDFPHANSTWPKSREVIARDLDGVSPTVRDNLLRGTVSRVYNLPNIAPLAL